MVDSQHKAIQPRARWRVRELAARDRWNARKLSLATGLSYTTMYGIWTNATTRADLNTIAVLCQVLKVAPSDIIEIVSDDHTQL